MPLIKTSDLIGQPLEYASASCIGYDEDRLIIVDGIVKIRESTAEEFVPCDLSTDWRRGGPAFFKAGVNVGPCLKPSDPSDVSQAFLCNANGVATEIGPDPLVAAMRCIVSAIVGAVVSVPASLVS